MTLAGVSYNFFDDLQPKAIFVPLLSLLILSIWFLHSYIRLHHIPGPFFASLTNLSRVSWILSNRAHDIHVNLHKKYGRLVRFGPNMVSVGDPAEIPNIYSFTGKFAKVNTLLLLLFRLPHDTMDILTRITSLISTTCSFSTQRGNPYRLFLRHRMNTCIGC